MINYDLIFLGVNIDHVATVRQARGTRYPDPIEAVFAAENGGADGITVHLREDTRHIQKRDAALIQEVTTTRLNLEMAVTNDMIAYAKKIKPMHCCLVPEKREELTTEGGLDIIAQENKIKDSVHQLKDHGIEVSLFIDPERAQIEAARRAGAPVIEIHTGAYADAINKKEQEQEWVRIQKAVTLAHEIGLIVNAGHGLHYHNVQAIAKLPINELNIGHSIVARALFVGLEQAVREMKRLMMEAKGRKYE